jgi:alkanesulfonate monooxygenase SsuD/methylene tetrahydromethanopterin reductase-like flavin-dependent oxidoreductase (luciferase family)
LLSLAARQADSVGILARSNRNGAGLDWTEDTEASVADKVQLLRQSAPDRFNQLELAMLIWSVAVTDNRRAAAERVAAETGHPVEHILSSPYYLIGTVDQIVDQLREQRERTSISYVSVFPADTEAFAPVVARLAGT